MSYADEICRGLYLRVTCHGTKSFSVMRRVGGRQQRLTLGEYPALSLAAARGATRRLIEEAHAPASQRDVAVRPAQPAPGLSLRELVADYKRLHLLVNTRGGATGAAVFNQARLAPLMDRAVTSITKAELVAVLDEIVADGVPHASVNLFKGLRAIFNWAVARDVLAATPCVGMRPPARGNTRDRVLTDAEVTALMSACRDMRPPICALVLMLLFTGARRCEMSKAKWSEFHGTLFTVPAARSKNGRANVLPLPPAAMAILAAQPRQGGPDGYVFTTTNGKSPFSAFSKGKLALDQLGAPTQWRLHDLRRLWRTKASQLGVPREVARRVLGHSIDGLDARYDHHDFLAEKGEALARVAALYETMM